MPWQKRDPHSNQPPRRPRRDHEAGAGAGSGTGSGAGPWKKSGTGHSGYKGKRDEPRAHERDRTGDRDRERERERPFSDERRPSHKGTPHKSASRPHAGKPRDASAHGTSWEKSADWYDKIIGAQGSELYQRIVIPCALDMLRPKRDESILDLGCGQGVFTRALSEHGAKVTGLDASASLVRRAEEYPSPKPIRYVTRDAADLKELGTFDAVSSILALQNMEHLDKVCVSAAKVLRDGGRMLWVLNHPCFRIPRQTAWGFDDERKIQYRRVDGYSSPMSIPIVMHPGQAQSESTTSFHKNLSDLMHCALSAGFLLAGFEEWHSDKQSQPGPRARAENRARDEFPLFVGMLWVKRAA
ncbi:ubiquinone/menaquinone biosynthesis C-methylase UbiE [Roseimicrobium gellanilyticum]|uniref:Ubiquinone/menaquinone biosynthesis C-methylase UbiE n=1 Tax=Roseimicrobium gellanilyticum TaxID=748857 RepID=A0A366HD49_9BACT|nr:class I SAM-dependent methyltransferase [Roseimicrobium gellanilyticum]RBP40381.1 ubiquinone/menaquinone biosynthesis C-methylase UbiE [Roseimicrobium gellanilyticum]